ncbi:DgyrCDS6238 [Dimorphilus gyrociliatus]|uniref:DgyrCDS6238 n=1 Tax=Dimorphilus gyrociliatus TaxID=2664684 RepID=A0A7I8VP40_9ANNE|nr:DgyrCDS6238 [Dimorphilus gyrociliatus]
MWLDIILLGVVVYVSSSSRIPDDPEKCLYWKRDTIISNRTDIAMANSEKRAVNASSCASFCLNVYPDCRASSYTAETSTCKMFTYAKVEKDLVVEIGTEYLVVGKGALEPDGVKPNLANSSIDGNYTCRSGWKQFGSYCYQYVRQPAIFTVADFKCQHFGGDLVSIHSRKENEFVVNLITAGPKIYTGLLKESGVSAVQNFLWTDGSKVTYYNWEHGEPNNVPAPANCVHIQRGIKEHKWQDSSCYEEVPYVCKKKGELKVTS